MSGFSVKGLVLREEDFGEKDKMLTVLTKECGKMFVCCKGVRNLASARFSAAQFLSYSDISLTESRGKHYLKEAETIESFYGVRSSLEGIYLASYIAEAISCVTVEGQADEDILSLALNCLYVLSEEKYSPLFIKAVFEMRLSALLGFSPDVSVCSLCSEPFGQSENYFIDISGGVILCADCVFGDNKGMMYDDQVLTPIDSVIVKAIGYICVSSPKRIFFSFDENRVKELANITERYFLSHVERTFTTLEFLKTMM